MTTGTDSQLILSKKSSPKSFILSEIAINATIDSDYSEECWVSYGVPFFRKKEGTENLEEIESSVSEPSLGFFMASPISNYAQMSYSISSPYASVCISWETAECVQFDSLVAPNELHMLTAVAEEPCASARELLPEQYEALSYELWNLTDKVFDCYVLFNNRESNSEPLLSSDRDVLIRYQQVFRLLVDPSLYPYYKALNPYFFEWLSEQTENRLEDLNPIPLFPQVDSDYPKPVLPELYETEAVDALYNKMPVYSLDALDIVFYCEKHVETCSPFSPLQEVFKAPSVKENALKKETLTSMQSVYGDNALEKTEIWQALAKPAVEIVIHFAESAYLGITRAYANDKLLPGEWVRFEPSSLMESLGKNPEEFSFRAYEIVTPFYPESLLPVLLTHMQSEPLIRAEQTMYTFKYAELFAVGVVCDFMTSINNDREHFNKTIPLSSLHQISEAPSENKLTWVGLLKATLPPSFGNKFLKLDELFLKGVDLLIGQDYMAYADNEKGIILNPKLRVIINQLKNLEAYTAISMTHFLDENTLEIQSEHFTALRLSESLWGLEFSEGEQSTSDIASLEINLFEMNGYQLEAILKDFFISASPSLITELSKEAHGE